MLKVKERRKRIVNEAARLYDEAGYHQTSMGDLAAAVGLAKPTLYHYFASKDEILACIVEQWLSIPISQLRARAEAGMSAVEQLEGAMGDILECNVTHRAHVRVFFEYRRELGAEFAASAQSLRAEYQKLVEDVIRQGVECGEFRSANERTVAFAVLGMCNWTYHWLHDRPLPPREMAHEFFQLIYEGLKPTGASAVDS